MKFGFDDPQFSFQLLRVLGSAAWGGADPGECLAAASLIEEGDYESWYRAWFPVAQRVRETGERCEQAGHRASALESFLRATSYYRMAGFYLHGRPDDPRLEIINLRALSSFARVVEHAPFDLEPVEIPFEGTVLPGYFYRADGPPEPRATLIAQQGFDGTQEELYGIGRAAIARGMHCLTFEGPGQGRVIHEQGLPFRPDWETVVTPVVDFLLGRPGVDADRVAILGLSLGGYLVPRACAYEHRLAACVANGGVFDFMAGKLPPGISREDMRSLIEKDPAGMDLTMREVMKDSADKRWAMEQGMYAFGVKSPSLWYEKALDYHLEGIAGLIRCPTLVVDVEDERFFPGAARQLFDALECPGTWMLFTRGEGAGDHCQVASPLLAGQRILDWVQETLGPDPVAP